MPTNSAFGLLNPQDVDASSGTRDVFGGLEDFIQLFSCMWWFVVVDSVDQSHEVGCRTGVYADFYRTI